MSNKPRLDTFSNTNLADMLEDFQCRTVVICGFLTSCCVESTMRTACGLFSCHACIFLSLLSTPSVLHMHSVYTHTLYHTIGTSDLSDIADERGFNVITITDCTADTSMRAYEAATDGPSNSSAPP